MTRADWAERPINPCPKATDPKTESNPRRENLTMYVIPHFETWLRSRIIDDRGASLVEYALVLALIAMVCIAAVTALGETTSSSFSEAVSKLD